MAGRWGLFRRFLSDRLKVRFNHSWVHSTSPDHLYQEDMDSDSPSKTSSSNSSHPVEVPELSPTLKLIEASTTRLIMDDLLTHYYSPFEIWYLRVITDKVRCAMYDR